MDYKLEDNIVESDPAVEVVAVGSNASELKVGDQGFALVPGSSRHWSFCRIQCRGSQKGYSRFLISLPR
jgi:hypothetical protein